MTRDEKLKEIGKVARFDRAAEKEINAIGIVPRVPYNFPFDIVGLATLSKAFSLSNACLKLLRSDQSNEAFALSRSIVECANNLRYMTEKPDTQDKRVRNFVNQHKADKAYWAHHCLELFAGRPEEQDIRDYMQQEGITPDTKPASRHWSGERAFVWDTMTFDHPLDGPVTEKYKKISYAADYFQTSTFVHCSLPAIDNHAVEEGTPFRVSMASGLHETTQSTLFTVLVYLHRTICYAMYGMNLESPKTAALFQQTLNSMKPYKRQYSKIKHSP